MRSGKKIIITTLALLVIVFLIVVTISHFFGGPAEGQVSTGSNLSTTASTSSFNLNPVSVSGTYVNFEYPTGMIADTNKNSSAATLASYLYEYKDIQTWLLAVQVSKLNQPTLENNSSYSLRAQDPTRYQESITNVGNKKYYVFRDLSASGFAEAAFILKGNISTSISLIGNDPTSLDNLQNTFNLVLNSFQWKQ